MSIYDSCISQIDRVESIDIQGYLSSADPCTFHVDITLMTANCFGPGRLEAGECVRREDDLGCSSI